MAHVNVALIGYAFMGRAHSNAWRQVGRFFTPKLTPRMKVICGRTPKNVKDGGRSARLGGGRHRLARGRQPARTSTSSTSARRATATPRSRSPRRRPARSCSARSRSRTRCAEARADARRGEEGRRHPHDLPQLPARAGGDAGQAADRARASSGRSITIAARTCRTGSPIRAFPLVWRLQKDKAGSGALGDIASHSLDLARFLVGEITEVTGRARDVRQGTAAARQPEEEGHGDGGRCVGVDRALRQRRARHDRGDAASRPGARTTTASRSTAARARSRSTSSA